MNGWYNPVVRSFNAYRRALMEFGLPRERLRPCSRLDDLVPEERREEAWAALVRHGLAAPGRIPPEEIQRVFILLAGVPLGFIWWNFGPWIAAVAFVPLLVLAWWTTRPLARPGNPVDTLGELVFAGLDFTAHRHSGYRWARGDIALKVRIMIAEVSGAPLSGIQEETRLIDL